MAEKIENEVKVVWQLESDSHLVSRLNRLIEISKDKRSIEYMCEELLDKAIKGEIRYIKADGERRDREAYSKEVKTVMIPAITGDSDVDAKSMLEYATRMQKLQVKYHQGGTKVEMR
jgi:hypothetical protein